MEHVKNILDGINPTLFYLAVSGVTWLLVWAWRRWLPGLWVAATKKSPTLQQLPALVLAGLMSAAPALGRPLWDVVQQVVLGAIMGALTSAGIHWSAKEIPWVPYQGGKPPAVDPNQAKPPAR